MIKRLLELNGIKVHDCPGLEVSHTKEFIEGGGIRYTAFRKSFIDGAYRNFNYCKVLNNLEDELLDSLKMGGFKNFSLFGFGANRTVCYSAW